MPARVRARLSYANVVATLALFLALGGSSYAVTQITSKDVRNRSLKGGDLRKNTLTGTEINESRLGEIARARRALNADNATTAQVAASAATADISKSANTAGTANVAALAQDAQALAGQGVGAFEKSSRVAFGRAPADPADAAGEQVLISWPELGVQLTSAADQAGCAGGELRVGVRNTKAAGSPAAIVYEEDFPGILASAGAGNTVRPCTNANTNEFQGMITDESRRVLFVDCRNVQGDLRCLGIRSEP